MKSRWPSLKPLFLIVGLTDKGRQACWPLSGFLMDAKSISGPCTFNLFSVVGPTHGLCIDISFLSQYASIVGNQTGLVSYTCLISLIIVRMWFECTWVRTIRNILWWLISISMYTHPMQCTSFMFFSSLTPVRPPLFQFFFLYYQSFVGANCSITINTNVGCTWPIEDEIIWFPFPFFLSSLCSSLDAEPSVGPMR